MRQGVLFAALLLFSFCMQGAHPQLLSNHTISRAEKKYGEFARNRFLAYNTLLKEAQNKPLHNQLSMVNDFFNDVPYLSDKKNWQKKDYWATPIEFLGKDKGDCEDYVIAKLFALKALGISTDKLFMTYVRSSRFKQPHMVLTYFETPQSEPLILDNTNFKVFPASQRQDLSPIYNFNGYALYIAKAKGKGKKVNINQKTHQKWNQLIQRMQRNSQ
jgi:predicted transglutaminase-like cysteine proteinase